MFPLLGKIDCLSVLVIRCSLISLATEDPTKLFDVPRKTHWCAVFILKLYWNPCGLCLELWGGATVDLSYSWSPGIVMDDGVNWLVRFGLLEPFICRLCVRGDHLVFRCYYNLIRWLHEELHVWLHIFVGCDKIVKLSFAMWSHEEGIVDISQPYGEL